MFGKRLRQFTLAILILLIAGIGWMLKADIPAEEIRAKYTDSSSKFIDIDGLALHYKDQGQGPALVLVHGSNASLHTWAGWVKELSKDFRIITLDLPGHGVTGPDPKVRYDPISMAGVIDKFLQKIGVDRFSIAGNSMGGWIAWNYAVKYPEKVEKLILIDSAGYPREEPLPIALRAYGLPYIGKLATYITPRFAVEISMKDIYGDPTKVREKDITLYHELLLREGNREATRTRLSLHRDKEAYKKIATIKAPTLIMWGDLDRWILPKYGTRFADDIEGSTLITYEDLGHAPMEEDPIRTARDAKNFLLSD
ncbi:MAG: alpha/beta hydrolase [Sneathiella sp.]